MGIFDCVLQANLMGGNIIFVGSRECDFMTLLCFLGANESLENVRISNLDRGAESSLLKNFGFIRKERGRELERGLWGWMI